MKPVLQIINGLMATLLLMKVTNVTCHVGLTFPPAREYDLDFLDNVRTRAPCGMPKGKEKLCHLQLYKIDMCNNHDTFTLSD